MARPWAARPSVATIRDHDEGYVPRDGHRPGTCLVCDWARFEGAQLRARIRRALVVAFALEVLVVLVALVLLAGAGWILR